MIIPVLSNILFNNCGFKPILILILIYSLISIIINVSIIAVQGISEKINYLYLQYMNYSDLLFCY